MAAYRGRHGLEKKEEGGGSSTLGEDDDLPVCSKGATGAAVRDVIKRRLDALKATF